MRTDKSQPADILPPGSTARRVGDAATMFVVSLVSVWLLIFIAYGTSKRTYEQLIVDKSAAQAELVRNPIEAYLRPGLPLRQFTGFKQLTTSMLEGDPSLISVVVEHIDAELAFNVGDVRVRTLEPGAAFAEVHGDGDVRRSDDLVQVVLPLKNKFERVGNLVLTIDRKTIQKPLTEWFRGNIGRADFEPAVRVHCFYFFWCSGSSIKQDDCTGLSGQLFGCRYCRRTFDGLSVRCWDRC
jgi:hypothetical protein